MIHNIYRNLCKINLSNKQKYLSNKQKYISSINSDDIRTVHNLNSIIFRERIKYLEKICKNQYGFIIYY